ncbi:hypothetical protein AAFF_G00351270 [Aldrovandia affinis]|uniref:Uncharacterized protein n=1 Tax=Aldrovandia affinis TaxID=143900 RepID=A0AAD7SIN4_9TELE|nr:hypothetical protein AAFF_G00351270 [Aldrovandia affinis]
MSGNTNIGIRFPRSSCRAVARDCNAVSTSEGRVCGCAICPSKCLVGPTLSTCPHLLYIQWCDENTAAEISRPSLSEAVGGRKMNAIGWAELVCEDVSQCCQALSQTLGTHNSSSINSRCQKLYLYPHKLKPVDFK